MELPPQAPKALRKVPTVTPYSVKPLIQSVTKVAFEPECFNTELDDNPSLQLRLILCFEVHSAAETDLFAESGVQIT